MIFSDISILRLKHEIRSGEGSGIFLEYPLLKNGVCLWPGKYPDKEAIEMQRKELGSNIEWQREFLLNIVPDMDQVIFKEWFKRYDIMPTLDKSFVGVIAGIDLAYTKHDYSDYTAIVIAYAFYFERELYLYILPNPINERILSPDVIERCKLLNEYYKKQDLHIQFLVEQAGQQIGVIDHLQKAKLDVRGVKVGRQDKRFRQSLTAPQIKSAHVLFPHKGCEKLEYQLTHFGVGHDDLADALATLVLGTMEHPPRYRHSVSDIVVGGKPRHYPDGADLDRYKVTLDTRF